MSPKLSVNMFDVALIVVLFLGLLRGRKHGMSEELMNVLKWLAVLLTCAFLYEPLGTFLAESSPFSLLASFLIVYITLALAILGLFALLKHRLGGKLIGSDIFGRSEYYLGMISGLVRFACILLVCMAVLNARYFSPQEVRAMQAFQNDVYGKEYFPTWHTAQSGGFENSASGSWIKDHLGFLLIKPTRPENKDYHQKDYSVPGA
ncbi:MAG TPA: CvpA family protein [Verrucomicrobiae bacterium]|nr:CvpA family protein [Verrucomicrobiae bacterium]